MRRLFLIVMAGCVGIDPDSDPGDTADTDAGTDVDTDEGTGAGTGTETGFVWPAGLDIRVCTDGTADYTEIQDAIDASSPGDTIGVCPGTYGPIEVLWGFEVDIVGIEGPGATSIDGGTGSAVFVKDGALDLSGFHITGTGYNEEWATDHGGAFTFEEGDVTVTDCVVEGVTGPYAMVLDENYLVMDNVEWRDNFTDYLWYLYQITEATITHNTITGGVHQTLLESPDIDNLTLANNVFADITIDAAFTAFIFTGNGRGTLEVYNNVFYNLDDLDPWGGRIFSVSANTVLKNNIVVGCDSGNLNAFEASYSLFWDNNADYSPYVTGTGNLYVDPLFVDAAGGDFHLQAGSPAIDAGVPYATFYDADGTRNDMGRYGGE